MITQSLQTCHRVDKKVMTHILLISTLIQTIHANQHHQKVIYDCCLWASISVVNMSSLKESIDVTAWFIAHVMCSDTIIMFAKRSILTKNEYDESEPG